MPSRPAYNQTVQHRSDGLPASTKVVTKKVRMDSNNCWTKVLDSKRGLLLQILSADQSTGHFWQCRSLLAEQDWRRAPFCSRNSTWERRGRVSCPKSYDLLIYNSVTTARTFLTPWKIAVFPQKAQAERWTDWLNNLAICNHVNAR